MPIAIKAENLSKAYQLGEIGTGTLSRDLERWVSRIRGKEDPFLRIGEVNDRTIKGTSDIVWSLKDINFEIEQGDAVGIIGRNGAGKSTLLKILSRVTSPTTGSITGKGRIASLLEVGTGFHPELTGRENIYLNGAILGMRKREIAHKFEEIVEFSGIERYIDTPVKRYSSGMYVRLAFAVAAHLESEILVVDEVLAVGDAEFQKKCLGKMGEVSREQGKTILFVSHNMTAISNLCSKAIVLENGKTAFIGKIQEGVNSYLSSLGNVNNNIKNILGENADEVFDLIDFTIKQEEVETYELKTSKNIIIHYSYKVKKQITGLRIGLDLIDKEKDLVLFRTFHDDYEDEIKCFERGIYESSLTIEGNFLKNSSYVLNILVTVHNVRWIINDSMRLQINLTNINGVNKLYADERPGVILPKLGWVTKKIDMVRL